MKIQTLMLTSVAAVSLLITNVAYAEYTANVAVSSNYVWRGVTQTNDLSSVSGGIDWSHPDGAYVGGWTSNLGSGDYELDLYGGYGFSSGTIDLDVGFINYRYPVTNNTPANFAEIYVNASIEYYTVGGAFTVSKDGQDKKNDLYIYGLGEYEVKKDLNLAITLGTYNYDDANNKDYFHVQAAVSKEDLTFALDKNNLDGAAGSYRISVTWAKSIDL